MEQAPSQNLQDLLNKYKAYDALNWFSKDFFTKLWQGYSNLNALRAQSMINAVIKGEGDLSGVDLEYCAKILVSAKMSIPYLITEMRQNNVKFYGENIIHDFLTSLEKFYVNQPGISNAEQDSRVTHILAIPIKVDLTDKSIKKYITSSALVISALLKNVHGNEKYGQVIAECIEKSTLAHAVKLATISYDRLQRYNCWYDRPHFDQPNGINQFNPRLNKREILPKIHVEGIEKINKWINNLKNNQVSIKLHRPFLQFVQETTPWFAWMRGYQPLEQRLWNSLNINRLVGSGYEQSIAEYVAKAPADKKNEAISYAVSVACKKIQQDTKESIKAVKDSLRTVLEVPQVGLTDDQKKKIKADIDGVKTVGEKIAELKRLTASTQASVPDTQYRIQLLLKDIVKDIESNSRLKRIFQGAMMKKLKDKEKAAAGILLGKDSVENMARVVLSDIDSELLGRITHLMSGTMTDIEAKYNLEPGYLSKISRRYNKVVAYPVWLFFEVLDFFAMLLEYAVEYTTRAGYWVYENARGVSEHDKRVNKTILHTNDIETLIAGMTAITKTPAEILRNEIIKYLKDDKNGDAVYKAIFPVLLDKHSSQQLKNALRKIKCDDSKYDKEALSALLEHLKVKLTPAETLRNEIIKYVAGGDNRGELTKAIEAVSDDANSSQQLKTAIAQISDKHELDKKDLSNLLKNYEMKDVGSYAELLNWQTQAAAISSLTKT
jgi:hypothetical protein